MPKKVRESEVLQFADPETSRLERALIIATRHVRHMVAEIPKILVRTFFFCETWAPCGEKRGMVPCPKPPSPAPGLPELELVSEMSGPIFSSGKGGDFWIPRFSDFVCIFFKGFSGIKS